MIMQMVLKKASNPENFTSSVVKAKAKAEIKIIINLANRSLNTWRPEYSLMLNYHKPNATKNVAATL